MASKLVTKINGFILNLKNELGISLYLRSVCSAALSKTNDSDPTVGHLGGGDAEDEEKNGKRAVVRRRMRKVAITDDNGNENKANQKNATGAEGRRGEFRDYLPNNQMESKGS